MGLLFKNLLFTLLVPGTTAVALPLWIARGAEPRPGPLGGIGIALLVLGAAIYAWCVWDFARFGRGTPAPIDAPRRLVVRGLYRFTRNPMYVGVLAVIFGWALLFRSPAIGLYGLILASGFETVIRLYEEPHLARTFGAEYAAYRAEVGRWLPRPPRARGGR